MPFLKGHKYNKRTVANTFRRLAAQSPDKLRKACESVFDQAADGDLDAFQILADRLDGKALQVSQVQVEQKITIDSDIQQLREDIRSKRAVASTVQ
jgi:hypothetical protein